MTWGQDQKCQGKFSHRESVCRDSKGLQLFDRPETNLGIFKNSDMFSFILNPVREIQSPSLLLKLFLRPVVFSPLNSFQIESKATLQA